MKLKAVFAALILLSGIPSLFAGGVSFYATTGGYTGCYPQPNVYYTPVCRPAPVYYCPPRPAYYCPPPVVYYNRPVYYTQPVYRVSTPVYAPTAGVSFGWRR